MKPHLLAFALILSCSVLVSPPALAGDHWQNWRGPAGDGTLAPSDGETYPTEWSSTDNILWRTDVDVLGNSSPIVWGDRVFLTQGENDNRQRSLLCFSTANGELLWKRTVERPSADPTHKTNPGVSASPVTDGERVYAWHGNAGLHAYDLDGNGLWTADLGDDYAHIWGANASSPVLFENLVLVYAGPGPAVRLFAIDRDSSAIAWQKELPAARSENVDQFKGSWTTPRLLDNAGRPEMLVPLPTHLVSFDPRSGDELWRCGGLGDLYYTNTLVGSDTIVAMSGYRGPGIGMRLPKPTETGDLTDSHRLWRHEKPPQRIGSGQIVGRHIYMVNAPGLAQCLDLATGETVWEQRLGRETWSSLNLVGGLLYSMDKSGTTHVFKPSPEGLDLVASNRLTPPQDNANATPAFAGGVIYLRTPTALYAIGQ